MMYTVYNVYKHCPVFECFFYRLGTSYRQQLLLHVLSMQVTNFSGIEWIKRTLGSDYRIHVLAFNRPHAMHIDAFINIPKPGIVIINANPDKEFTYKGFFEDSGWKVLYTLKSLTFAS